MQNVKKFQMWSLAMLLLAAAVSQAQDRPQDRQSPVDFNRSVLDYSKLPKLKVTSLSITDLKVQNTFNPNGTNGVGGAPVPRRLCTVKANVSDPNAGTLTVNGRNYSLFEFHFHTPSEHTIDNDRTPMEVHFVFRDVAKEPGQPDSLLVVGAWIVTNTPAGKDNREFAKIFSNLPATTSYITVSNFNLKAVFPSTSSTFRYPGSLTSPAKLDPYFPLSVADQIAEDIFPDVVSWVVSDETIGLSSNQIEAFRSLFPDDNSRNTHPIGQRRVLHDKKPHDKSDDDLGNER